MRRPVTFSAIAGLAFFLTVSPNANAQAPTASNRAAMSDHRWSVLAEDERAMIDRVAAEFYEHTMRSAQSSAIEDQTSVIYKSANKEQRAAFREARRAELNSMSAEQRAALRDAKRPTYRNLADSQKAPFRAHAIDQLRGAGALDEEAANAVMRRDI